MSVNLIIVSCAKFHFLLSRFINQFGIAHIRIDHVLCSYNLYMPSISTQIRSYSGWQAPHMSPPPFPIIRRKEIYFQQVSLQLWNLVNIDFWAFREQERIAWFQGLLSFIQLSLSRASFSSINPLYIWEQASSFVIFELISLVSEGLNGVGSSWSFFGPLCRTHS